MDKIAKTLTTADRRRLKASAFAVSKNTAKKEEPTQQPAKNVKGKYPMPDRSHAISAVGYVRRHGTPAEKSLVYHKAANEFGVGPLAEKAKTASVGHDYDNYLDKIAEQVCTQRYKEDVDFLKRNPPGFGDDLLAGFTGNFT